MLKITFDSGKETRFFDPKPSLLFQKKEQKYLSIVRAIMAWINIITPWSIQDKLYLHGGAVLHMLFGENMPLNDFDFLIDAKIMNVVIKKIGKSKMLPIKCGDYIFSLEFCGKVECGLGEIKNNFIKLSMIDTTTNITYQVEILEKTDVSIDFYLNSIEIEYSLSDHHCGNINLSYQQLQDLWCFINKKPIHSLQFSFLSSALHDGGKIFHKVFYRLLKILEKDCSVFGVKDSRKEKESLENDICPVCFVSCSDCEIEIKKILISCCPNNHYVCMCCLLKLDKCPICRQNISFSHLERRDFSVDMIQESVLVMASINELEGGFFVEEQKKEVPQEDIKMLLPEVSIHRKISWGFMNQMFNKQDNTYNAEKIDPYIDNKSEGIQEQEVGHEYEFGYGHIHGHVHGHVHGH
jgi:hypothetical protein